MSHPQEYRAHFNEAGQVCHCPWGVRDPERYGSVIVKEASKLDWLESRPDFQEGHPEFKRNEFFLEHVKAQELDKYDKMLPWLHREYKKGRLLPGGDHYRYRPQGIAWNDNEIHIPEGEKKPWLTHGTEPHQYRTITPQRVGQLEESLDEMQKRRQGVDLMQHKVHELEPKVQDFEDWKGQQKRKEYGEVMHKFDNGWTIRRLQNDAEHRDEGNNMSHCVGQPQYGYAEHTEKGTKIYASLRDEMNNPHTTLEITPDHWEDKEGNKTFDHRPPEEGWVPRVGSKSDPEQFFGPHDSTPEPEHEEMVNEWLQEHNAPNVDGEGREADRIGVMPAYDPESYNAIHGDSGEYMEYANDTDEEGRPAGETTEYEFAPPEWGSIASNYLKNGPHTHGYRQQDVSHMNQLGNTLRRERHSPAFEQALEEEYDPEDPNHVRNYQAYQQEKQPYYHPYTGEYVEGYESETSPMAEFQKPLFEENPEAQYWDQRYVQPLLGPEGDRVPDAMQRAQGPAPNLYTYSRASKPLYQRWVFSPTKGVTLGSNADDHPAFVKYHQGLGGDINDTDLSHGYAYPIGNGWRITDIDHQAVQDPYIVNQVVRSLNLGGSPQISPEASWRPAEYDFDRLHYGLPKELADK